MAQILRQAPTGDGYDVIVESGKQSHVLHFLSQPSEDEKAERIAQFEQARVTEDTDNRRLEVWPEADERIDDGSDLW
jgi:hypothetical protein